MVSQGISFLQSQNKNQSMKGEEDVGWSRRAGSGLVEQIQKTIF